MHSEEGKMIKFDKNKLKQFLENIVDDEFEGCKYFKLDAKLYLVFGCDRDDEEQHTILRMKIAYNSDDLQSDFDLDGSSPVIDNDGNILEAYSYYIDDLVTRRYFSNVIPKDAERLISDINDAIELMGKCQLSLKNETILGLEYEDGILYAGEITNSGIFHDYELDYDWDKTFDENIQNLGTFIEV